MKALKNHWQLYLLFCLPLLYVIVFKYVPMYGAIIAFKNFDPTLGIWGSPWVGLDNFIKFIHSYEFGRVLKNTLLLSLYHLIAGFPFPIILALSLNYVYRKRFKKFAQMITYAPHFISVVVIVGIILLFLSPRGPFSQVLSLFGVHNVDIMGEPSLFKSIYVWSDIWQNVGFGCIIYLAALTGVSPSLHEAAIIDGASILKRIWHIDIPGILPTTIILLILNMGSILDTGFQKVLLLQNSLNLSSSEVIDTFVYKVGLVAPIPQYSYAAAIGFFKAAIAFVLIIGANRLARKVGQESLW
ncbi:ABC transporter permease [Pullulanibacillus pueri]|nr:ABC transporter permease subunit [Pullulanibacillus pueri]